MRALQKTGDKLQRAHLFAATGHAPRLPAVLPPELFPVDESNLLGLPCSTRTSMTARLLVKEHPNRVSA